MAAVETDERMEKLVTPWTSLQAIDFLRTECWQKGVPIVPLFGSGISVGAGVPVVAEIEDYLIKLRSKHRNSIELITGSGWPARHQLNVDLNIEFDGTDLDGRKEKMREIRARTYLEAIADEAGESNDTLGGFLRTVLRNPAADRPLVNLINAVARLVQDAGHAEKGEGDIVTVLRHHTEWRALLKLLTGGSPQLIDAFFDRTVRGRQPSSTHQFVAFLTKLLNWRLILTTNFDDLVEMALRGEGLSPVVYELTREGPIPAAALVRRNLSVVKLHGGAFGLRAGFDLDEALDENALAVFRAYAPDDAVVLVVGYGGGDRRVLSILEALAKRGAGERRILWLHRNPTTDPTAPGRLSRTLSGMVQPVQYANLRLFLHEMYYRFTHLHPVTHRWYRALYHLPPSAPVSENELAAQGGNAALAHAVRKREIDGQTTVWLDLSETRTCATIISMLLGELRRYDRWLLPTASTARVALAPTASEIEPDPNVVRAVLYALRRGRYSIVFDRIAAFGLRHPADPTSDKDPEEAREFDRLLALLRKLTSDPARLGESIIWLGVPIKAEKERAGALQEFKHHVEQGPKDERRQCVPHDGDTRDEIIEENVGRWFATQLEVPDPLTLLIGALSAFRRPRSIVAIAQIAKALGSVVKQPNGWEDPVVHGRWQQAVATEWTQSGMPAAPATASERVEAFAKDACAVGYIPRVDLALLDRQDGGSYSMHGVVRDGIYKSFRTWADKHAKHLIADIHDTIANYYHDQLYEQSRDLAAYFEYVFHRLVSAGSLPEDAGLIRAARLRWLAKSLDRERDGLLGWGRASTVLGSLRKVQAVLQERWSKEAGEKEGRARDEVIVRAMAIQADVFRELGLHESGQTLREEIANRIGGGERGDRLRQLECKLEIAVSKSQLSGGEGPVANIQKIGADVGMLLRETADSTLANDGVRIQAKCAYHQIGIYADHPGLAIDRQAIEKIFKRGDRKLRRYLGGQRAARYKCYLRCNLARYLYRTSEEWEEAYRLLNEAHAAVAHGPTVMDRTAVAVTSLHLAELSLLRAMTFLNGSADEAVRWHTAREELSRANIALDEAQSGLLEGLRSVRWWGWLYLLRTRVLAAFLILSWIAETTEVRAGNPIDVKRCCLEGLRAAVAADDDNRMPDADRKRVDACKRLIVWAVQRAGSAAELSHYLERVGADDAAWLPTIGEAEALHDGIEEVVTGVIAAAAGVGRTLECDSPEVQRARVEEAKRRLREFVYEWKESVADRAVS